MDQRIAWPQPEQLGPSCEQWLRIWEAFHISETHLNLNYNQLLAKSAPYSALSQTCSNSNSNDDSQQMQFSANGLPNCASISSQCRTSFNLTNQQPSKSASTANRDTTSVSDQTIKRSDTNMQPTSEQQNANGDTDSCTENPVRSDANESTPWVRPAGYNASVPILGLHDEIMDFYAHVSPTPEECCMRQEVAARIRQLITSVWPSVRVEIFGSFKTGLYLPTSDIDMVVIGVGVWDKPPLRELERVIVDRRIAEPHNVKVLDNASVPIVRVTDQETDMRVDISFSSTELPSCLRSAELIGSYIQRYEPLRYLVLVLKQFLLERGLNETWTGGVGSYSLILMVVHFLQNHEKSDVTKNYGALLVEFFETFGERFNYQHLVLRIRNEKSSSSATTPDKAYLKKEEFTRAVQREEPSYCPSMLTIEDPLDPLRDIARGSYGALYARKAFQHALHALREPMLGVAHSLLVRNQLGNVPTYLGRIVRISREVSEYRQLIRRKFHPVVQAARQRVALQQTQLATVRNVLQHLSTPHFVDAAGFVRMTNGIWNGTTASTTHSLHSAVTSANTAVGVAKLPLTAVSNNVQLPNGVRLTHALHGVDLSTNNGILLPSGTALRTPHGAYAIYDLAATCPPRIVRQAVIAANASRQPSIAVAATGPQLVTYPTHTPTHTQLSMPSESKSIQAAGTRVPLRARDADQLSTPTRVALVATSEAPSRSTDVDAQLSQYALTNPVGGTTAHSHSHSHNSCNRLYNDAALRSRTETPKSSSSSATRVTVNVRKHFDDAPASHRETNNAGRPRRPDSRSSRQSPANQNTCSSSSSPSSDFDSVTIDNDADADADADADDDCYYDAYQSRSAAEDDADMEEEVERSGAQSVSVSASACSGEEAQDRQQSSVGHQPACDTGYRAPHCVTDRDRRLFELDPSMMNGYSHLANRCLQPFSNAPMVTRNCNYANRKEHTNINATVNQQNAYSTTQQQQHSHSIVNRSLLQSSAQAYAFPAVALAPVHTASQQKYYAPPQHHFIDTPSNDDGDENDDEISCAYSRQAAAIRNVHAVAFSVSSNGHFYAPPNTNAYFNQRKFEHVNSRGMSN